jgi:hypothetical protein
VIIGMFCAVIRAVRRGGDLKTVHHVPFVCGAHTPGTPPLDRFGDGRPGRHLLERTFFVGVQHFRRCRRLDVLDRRALLAFQHTVALVAEWGRAGLERGWQVLLFVVADGRCCCSWSQAMQTYVLGTGSFIWLMAISRGVGGVTQNGSSIVSSPSAAITRVSTCSL